MRFPPSFLDDIRARLPISQVVGRRVSWDKRKTNPGRGDFWACCPFHGEKTPSFHAEDRKGRYHCFGCGVSGDHFTFLVEQEGLSFPEAVAQLAAEAGLALPERDAESERREVARASLHDVVEKAAQFFEKSLQAADGGRARAYLRERGLTPEIQKRFRLGYAPASRNALKEHLAAAGITQEQMVEAGLLIAGEDIPVSFDRFRDRIMFPIADLRGRVIAFGGRALAADAQAKYLNSPETALFSKGRVLYNAHAARSASRRGGHVVIVEGYIDVIACVAAGFEASVAPLGTALTEDQLRLLWQMADEPTLCFDGDAAGMKAAFRAVELALPQLEPGKSLRFALLPEGQDPDDLVRSGGPESLQRALETARPLVDMLWLGATHGADLSTPERRAGLERDLRQAAATIRNSDIRRHYEIAIRENVDRHFGWRARRPDPRRPASVARYPKKFDVPPSIPSASLLANRLVREQRGGTALSLSDALLLGAFILRPEIAAERLETLAELRFAGKAQSALAAALGARLAESPEMSSTELSALLERDGHGKLTAEVAAKLRNSGLGGLSEASPERVAAAWDEAAHLRLRGGTLSIERQAVASALGREASEVHLSRLRDIQEQDQRGLRPDIGDETEAAMIVHPFKRR